MKLGLHISDFTWDGGAPELRLKLGQIAQRAEEAGVDRISVMDHVWQIGHIGPPEHEMLECYTALGWLAAKTERVKLLAMVTAVVYREPGLLAKAVTTLDVLSGGRAILGIGAAWNAEESAGLGLFFPPVAERFERLEEAILICKQMWSGDEGPFDGKHYHLSRTLNSPQALSRPHPPILIGGAGEKKTLKLVARYADACNIFGGPDQLRHKFAVLRQRCEEEGRPFDEIERSSLQSVSFSRETPAQVVDRFGALARAGVQHVIFNLVDAWDPSNFERLSSEVLPAVHAMVPESI